MNATIYRNLRIGVFVSTLGAAATAVAGPMLVLDHNANASPKHDAVMRCYQAVRDDVGPGHGLMFSNRVVTEQATSGQAIVVTATVWDNGSRVPIQGRCERGSSDNIVARVTRTDGPVVAKTGK